MDSENRVEKGKQSEDDFLDYVKRLEESGVAVKVTTEPGTTVVLVGEKISKE